MKLRFAAGILLLVVLPAVASGANLVPGNNNAILFTPCEWNLQYDAAAFREACEDQGYVVMPVRDEIENTTPACTPQQMRSYLQQGYGEWFINTHGSMSGFMIAAYESTQAGISQRNADFDYWEDHDSEGCLRKVRFIGGVGIEYDQVCVAGDYADVGGEVYNASCFSAIYQHVAWLRASTNEGYDDSTTIWAAEADLFWKRRNGEFGKPYRLSGKAREGMELQYFGDSSTVLSPVVTAIYPTSGSSVGGVDGWVEFDCAMDTEVPADRVIRGYGGTYGGYIVAREADWVSDHRIEYRVSPIRTGSGCGVIVDSAVAKTPFGQFLDGNQNPIGTDGRGPNRDQYRVSYTATSVDDIAAASFEGAGAFHDDVGRTHVWWVTDPERGSRSFTVYGDGTPLRTVDAQGETGRPCFYEVTLPTSGAIFRIVEETRGDGVDSESRPFGVGPSPRNLDQLRELNAVAAAWPERSVDLPNSSSVSKSTSGSVYDLYFVSTLPNLLSETAPVRSWWAGHDFTSTTVLLSSADPDELHDLAGAVYQDAVATGRSRMPMFVIVGEANEGLEPEKNIVGMYSPADVDSGCWWTCASDAMTFDVDGDTLADLPWTRVVGYTQEEIEHEVASTLEYLAGVHVQANNRTLFTVGDRTTGCSPVVEPLATLTTVRSLFESNGVPTTFLKDSDYGCYDYASRLHDWCQEVDAGVGGVFVSGRVSNRSNWCYFPTWTQNPPFALDSLHTQQRFLLHGPGCGIGDTHRNNPDWYASLLKAFLAADPAIRPSIVAGCAHLVGGWSEMHAEWASMYADHLFTNVSCYQHQVFNAYRQMGEEEPCMKPHLLGVGVFGFPVPPPGFSFVGVREGGEPRGNRASLRSVPNPFNPTTEIRYTLASNGSVDLRIYDVSGRIVRSLIESRVEAAGEHEVIWDGRSDGGRLVGSGVYFARLEAGGESRTSRMVIVR